ncbi:uncharacterized protein MELLADRAFT_118240 [Melampsora larici-populina 98AG31]|uniref:U1 small nuclear ribonucleoprotein C n=1 Tax=Melampsora larici-populina (strain 98AG31 / pathotype 3-4-7) TaxID=747676 RepID=F4S6N7_MELLP|nr:uncharacterized protein MELLADRAFT_118240 [Melampsora larici-populina 98AG31]EGF99721.1 hypothetical protein MELLADRAFT_118240 [Melampsora larici-populina 98AG31]
MGKYYCDYCDVFLVSESPSVRKAHNSGRNHLTNVRDYYSSLGHDKAQNIIDEITRMYESGGSNPARPNGGGGGGGGSMNGNMPGPPGMMRGPFPGPPGSGPLSNLPPFPPAMLALMNGGNSNAMNGGQPPMRFAGPPILNSNGIPPPSGPPGPPPGLGHHSSAPPPPHHAFGNNMPNGTGHQPNQPGPPGPPPGLIGGMNPERARQLGLM